MHLSCLPATSKHREAGKHDIVETFDADKHYGANQSRFLSYINLCLANKFRTLQSKRMKDALCRIASLSLTGQANDGDSVEVADEYCHAHSEFLCRAADVSEKRHWDRAFLLEFVEFVKREDPSVLPAIEAILATGTHGDTADFLGVTDAKFARLRNRIRELGRCFLEGEPVPRQHKPYKKRVSTKIGLRLAITR